MQLRAGAALHSDAAACCSRYEDWQSSSAARSSCSVTQPAPVCSGCARRPCAGLLQALPGLGLRALRYSMLVDGGKVVAVNVDEPGPKVRGQRWAACGRARHVLAQPSIAVAGYLPVLCWPRPARVLVCCASSGFAALVTDCPVPPPPRSPTRSAGRRRCWTGCRAWAAARGSPLPARQGRRRAASPWRRAAARKARAELDTVAVLRARAMAGSCCQLIARYCSRLVLGERPAAVAVCQVRSSG
jgi:hypothetical protein